MLQSWGFLKWHSRFCQFLSPGCINFKNLSAHHQEKGGPDDSKPPPTCKFLMILGQVMALPKKHWLEIIKDLLVKFYWIRLGFWGCIQGWEIDKNESAVLIDANCNCGLLVPSTEHCVAVGGRFLPSQLAPREWILSDLVSAVSDTQTCQQCFTMVINSCNSFL